MQYGRSPSFERTYRKLAPLDKAAAEQAITRLVLAFDLGQRSEGLGLKKLRDPFWEIRAGLSIRILFKQESRRVTFVVVGTHNDIRRYLKHC